jgi:hypothetical protein
VRRRLLNLVTLLSLLLCLAVCALWVRSVWGFCDAITATRASSWTAYSCENTLCLQRVFKVGGPSAASASVLPASNRWQVGLGGKVYGPRYHQMMSTRSPHVGGFSPDVSSGPYDAWSRTEVRFLAFPHWVVAALCAVVPLARLAVGVRDRRRHATGLCPRCGYDLRATPDRCPECGTAASSAPATP